jgi:hypothetical protein
MGELTETQIEELLGAYALDAVEADEVLEIEDHLATCPRCRAELSEHREVAGLFAFAGQTAPPGLWDRITASMQETPPELSMDRIRSSMVTPESLVGPSAPVIPIHMRRHRRSIGLRTYVATAAAAAVAVVALAVGVVHESDSGNSGTAGPQATGATMRAVKAALAEKGSRKVVLDPLSGHGASLDAVVTPSGTSYLYDPDLTPLGADRTYQLWGVVGNQQISYGLLGTDPAPVIRFQAGPGVRALAVTDEVSSGVVVTHEPFVVVGGVSPSL